MIEHPCPFYTWLCTPYWRKLLGWENEKRTLLYEFIGTLDEFNRALIILYLEEHSNKEIAQVLGISESNVSTKINRIKNKFKAQIRSI